MFFSKVLSGNGREEIIIKKNIDNINYLFFFFLRREKRNINFNKKNSKFFYFCKKFSENSNSFLYLKKEARFHLK